MTKRCSKCKRHLEPVAFYKCPAAKDGLRHWCKECCMAWHRSPGGLLVRRRYQQSEKGIAYKKSDRYKELHKKFRFSEKGRTYRKAYARSEKMKAYYRAYHFSEKKKEWIKKYAKAGGFYRINRRYYSTPKGKEAIRRAYFRKKVSYKVDASLTHNEWLSILERFNNRCAYCGSDESKLTRDHVTPIVDGGLHTKENVVPACQPCNSRKGRRAVALFH